MSACNPGCGGTAEAFGADVVTEDGVAGLIAEVTEALGRVTAVVANATGSQPEVGVVDLTWRTHLDQLEFFVQPGWIPVERHAGIDSDSYAAEVPLRRMGTPEDVAAMVGHLASSAGGFITGQRITVNGGHVI
jgi:NAD(P)-dependent dehydrogenase (short-subunit alcohol dehydrogenase family)